MNARKRELWNKWCAVRFKPGARVPVSGQYSLTDGRQATLTRHEHFPPTPRPNMTWKLADLTR